jgi:glyoxylase I family protein
MKIGVKTPGIHHITLRSANLERSRLFYVDVLGFPVQLEAPNLFIVAAGSTAVVVRGPDTKTPPADVFNPFRVGLDHIGRAAWTKRSSRESLQHYRRRAWTTQG